MSNSNSLFLMRHARAAAGHGPMQDQDRPLDAAGRLEAVTVGRFLSAEVPTPELVLCSPVVRTRETLDIMLAESGLSPRVEFIAQIYEASVPTLLSVVGEVLPETRSLLLLGHNPGIENLLRFVTGKASAMGTAELAKTVFRDVSWGQLKEGELQLEWLVSPRDLR